MLRRREGLNLKHTPEQRRAATSPLICANTAAGPAPLILGCMLSLAGKAARPLTSRAIRRHDDRSFRVTVDPVVTSSV